MSGIAPRSEERSSRRQMVCAAALSLEPLLLSFAIPDGNRLALAAVHSNEGLAGKVRLLFEAMGCSLSVGSH